MQSLLQAARVAASSGSPARLATIVNAEGSAFRSPGARLLILPNRIVGTLSDGGLDAEVAERALATPAEALPARWRYQPPEEDEPLPGRVSGCDGAITLLIEDLGSRYSNSETRISNLKFEISNPFPLASPAADTLAFIQGYRI